MRRMFARKSARFASLVLLSLMLGGLGASALAQRPGCGRDGARGKDAPACHEVGMRASRGGPAGERFAPLPDLTDQQREAMKKLREDGAKAMVPMRKEMMRLRHELAGEMMKDEPNAVRLQDLTRQTGELRTRMQLQRLEHRLAMRQVLTAEQRDRMLLRRGDHPGMRPHKCPSMQRPMQGRAWDGPGACVPGCAPGCAPGATMGCGPGAAMGCGPGTAMGCPMMSGAPGAPCAPCAPSAPSAPSMGEAPDCPMGHPGCPMLSWNDGGSFDPFEGFENEDEQEDGEGLFW